MSTWMFVCQDGITVTIKDAINPGCATALMTNPVRRARMLPRKTRTMGGTKLQQWMVAQTPEYARSPEHIHALRSELMETTALKHSSKRRPLIMSIIHARINKRMPGSMLAARAEGRIA